ncbi:MAG: TlyA family RNA methyltransferase [Syntrophobacteraceae bacterium]|jgi:23S rRNA (cytidine1920-2'-O)/16S rRNA (cytidine1409-2'-O)-methyltransferase
MAKSSARLDKLLVDRGLAPTRERAQSLVLAAKVIVNGRILTKAGQKVPEDSEVRIIGDALPYVSRGGLKLEHAIRAFSIEVSGRTAMDVGASTGGFTDCLLSFGACRVYAVDVGYGQLALKLRNDPRVVVLERKNIRYLPAELVPEPVQIATIDTSFISLKLVIPAVLNFLEAEGVLVALIKPQFEAGREQASRGGGVIRDPRIHEDVCTMLAEFTAGLGFEVVGIIPSPILGPKGNREFLMAAIAPKNR